MQPSWLERIANNDAKLISVVVMPFRKLNRDQMTSLCRGLKNNTYLEELCLRSATIEDLDELCDALNTRVKSGNPFDLLELKVASISELISKLDDGGIVAKKLVLEGTADSIPKKKITEYLELEGCDLSTINDYRFMSLLEGANLTLTRAALNNLPQCDMIQELVLYSLDFKGFDLKELLRKMPSLKVLRCSLLEGCDKVSLSMQGLQHESLELLHFIDFDFNCTKLSDFNGIKNLRHLEIINGFLTDDFLEGDVSLEFDQLNFGKNSLTKFRNDIKVKELILFANMVKNLKEFILSLHESVEKIELAMNDLDVESIYQLGELKTSLKEIGLGGIKEKLLVDEKQRLERFFDEFHAIKIVH